MYSLQREKVVKSVSEFYLLELHNVHWHIEKCEKYYRKHICLIALKPKDSRTLWK